MSQYLPLAAVGMAGQNEINCLVPYHWLSQSPVFRMVAQEDLVAFLPDKIFKPFAIGRISADVPRPRAIRIAFVFIAFLIALFAESPVADHVGRSKAADQDPLSRIL